MYLLQRICLFVAMHFCICAFALHGSSVTSTGNGLATICLSSSFSSPSDDNNDNFGADDKDCAADGS